MMGTVVGFAVLLLAGLAFGRTRRPSARSGRVWVMIALAMLAFPIATLMLAKLFDSNVLGWVFGLSLMAGFALVPCAAIFALGLWLGSRSRRALVDNTVDMVVHVERGTVHASDDAPPKQIIVQPHTTLRAMLALAIADSYLPGISGGKATWVVESSGGRALVDPANALRPIAVCAQQWTAATFLVPASTTVAAHFRGRTPRLNLRYRCQAEPHAVVAAAVVRVSRD